jgi:subtilisin family serine protease
MTTHELWLSSPAEVKSGWGGRQSALWGKGSKRRTLTLLTLILAFLAQLALVSPADAARMPKSLRDAIKANPTGTYAVIVTGTRPNSSSVVENKVKSAMSRKPSTAAKIKKRYAVVNAVSGTFTGDQLAMLDVDSGISSIVRDNRMLSAGTFTNAQTWTNTHGANAFWSTGLTAPTIAVVDSGVDASRAADFGARVLTQVNFTTLTPNSTGDGRGHGTFVAGIAAGQGDGFAGYAPTAKIVSLDVLADNGQGLVSDVIAAADWIYANKSKYGIRIANFSLTGSVDSSFMYDPLDKAVEKLWFSGVVVVAASGNYAINGAESGVKYAPGNDPFIITAAATDNSGSTGMSDDFNAPWSAYGMTYDGFRKPEVAASGRYMNGPVPATSTMYLERPERVVAPGYMWMSGTSFAAPVVSGAAAHVLSKNPGYTPDQVKGALMVAAAPAAAAAPYSAGVGEVKGAEAAMVNNPPNPNLALNKFLVSDPNGGTVPIFDSASWSSAAKADASWNSASWSSASWSSASWSSASWSSASWSSASWNSASWSSAELAEAALPTSTWESTIFVG